MSIDITYDGDVANLTLKRAAAVEIRERPTRAHVYGFKWDENPSRLSFDPGSATDLELVLRPGAKWPRYHRRPSTPGPDLPAAPVTPEAPAEPLVLYSDGGVYSVAALYSDGTPA